MRGIMGVGCLLVLLGGRPVAAGERLRAVGPHAAEDGSAVVSVGGVTTRVREVWGGERAAFLTNAGVRLDPFDVSKEGRPYFRTFRFDLVNRSPSEVRFNPSFLILFVGRDRLYPLGYAQLYGYLEKAIEDDAGIEALAPLLAETSVTLPPQTMVTKLLVFKQFPPRAKGAELAITGIEIGLEASLEGRVRFEPVDPTQ